MGHTRCNCQSGALHLHGYAWIERSYHRPPSPESVQHSCPQVKYRRQRHYLAFMCLCSPNRIVLNVTRPRLFSTPSSEHSLTNSHSRVLASDPVLMVSSRVTQVHEGCSAFSCYTLQATLRAFASRRSLVSPRGYRHAHASPVPHGTKTSQPNQASRRSTQVPADISS